MQAIKRTAGGNKEALDALEERWALWLLSLADEDLLTAKHEESFAKFKAAVLSDSARGEIIKNPKYYLRQGNRVFDAKQYPEALRAYETASRMNELNYRPKYYQALTLIKMQESSNESSKLEQGSELLRESQGLCADEVAKYRGITEHYHQLQQSAGVAEVSVSSESKLSEAVQPIDGISPVATSCKRYGKLLEVQCKVLEGIERLRAETGEALRKGEAFKTDTKALNSIYNSKDDREVIESLRADGLTRLAHSEALIPWTPIIFTGILGIIELAVGIALCTTGVGAIWGYGLIIEGAGDLVTAALTRMSREFDWRIYAGTKAASVALVFAGCGVANSGSKVALGVRVGVAITGAVPVAARPFAMHAVAQSEAEERLARIITSSGIEDKVKKINKLMEQFKLMDNPTCTREFKAFEELCAKKLTTCLGALPDGVVDYALLMPGSDDIVISAYQKVCDKHLDGLLSEALQDIEISDSLDGASLGAFTELEDHVLRKLLINW